MIFSGFYRKKWARLQRCKAAVKARLLLLGKQKVRPKPGAPFQHNPTKELLAESRPAGERVRAGLHADNVVAAGERFERNAARNAAPGSERPALQVEHVNVNRVCARNTERAPGNLERKRRNLCKVKNASGRRRRSLGVRAGRGFNAARRRSLGARSIGQNRLAGRVHKQEVVDRDLFPTRAFHRECQGDAFSGGSSKGYRVGYAIASGEACSFTHKRADRDCGRHVATAARGERVKRQRVSCAGLNRAKQLGNHALARPIGSGANDYSGARVVRERGKVGFPIGFNGGRSGSRA